MTGGGSGMGEATARRLAYDGAAVVVADVNAAGGGEHVARQIVKTGGHAVFQHTDVADPDSVAAMVARAISEYGRLDLAANVAGVPQAPAPLAETTLELRDRTRAVNDRGLFLLPRRGCGRKRDRRHAGLPQVLHQPPERPSRRPRRPVMRVQIGEEVIDHLGGELARSQSPLLQEAAQPPSQPHLPCCCGRRVSQGLQPVSQAGCPRRQRSFHCHLFLLPGTPEEEASPRTCRDYAEPVRLAHRRCQRQPRCWRVRCRIFTRAA